MTTQDAPETAQSADIPKAAAADGTTHRFEAEVDEVLRLVVGSLYGSPQVFLRELLSNASDALDKLRFRAATEEGLAPAEELRVRIEPNAEAKTLTIWDNGVGMSADELVSHLGTIAKSGTRELAKALRDAGKSADVSLIGQFGVGFYSAFLVADRVDVTSRAAGSEEAHRWSSDAKSTFTIAPAKRDVCGTSVELHLKDEHLDLLKTWKLEELIRTYSDYLPWPIELRMEREKSDLPEWRRINQGTPLWKRSPSEVEDTQYQELYKHVSHDWEAPLGWKHFRIEGTQEFAGIVYVPKRAPFDLFSPDATHGLRLHVKRVFVMEDQGEILPRWLRFLRGVIDSEDLPLNVSREILQDSRVTRVIRKQVVKQALDLLGEIARDRAEEYTAFFRTFGAVLKEGLIAMPSGDGGAGTSDVEAKKLAPLLRFETSKAEGLISLETIKGRMLEGQKAIRYVIGESRAQLLGSPHLEALVARGEEVILLTDPVDAWAIQALPDFEDTPIVSASAADLDLEQDDATKQKREEASENLGGLRDRVRQRLQDDVSEVRFGARMTDSPACLVLPEGGLAPHLERMLRSSQPGMPKQKRIMELNPEHPLVQNLAKLLEAEVSKADANPQVDAWIDVMHDQALIAEGSPLVDPGRFVKRVTTLLTDAASRSIADREPRPE